SAAGPEMIARPLLGPGYVMGFPLLFSAFHALPGRSLRDFALLTQLPGIPELSQCLQTLSFVHFKPFLDLIVRRRPIPPCPRASRRRPGHLQVGEDWAVLRPDLRPDPAGPATPTRAGEDVVYPQRGPAHVVGVAPAQPGLGEGVRVPAPKLGK